MKKTFFVAVLTTSMLLLSTPLSFALSSGSSASTDLNYQPMSDYVAVGTMASSPAQIPTCADLFGAPPPLTCYTPQFLNSAYDFPPTTGPGGLDGSGQTILIVDAYGSPTIQSDLDTFDLFFGVPPPPSFTIFCPTGCPHPSLAHGDPHHAPLSWALETSLDVEYAHAMAPGASIVLVVASSSSGDAINVAESAAIAKYPGSIMSQSFGTPEYLIHGNNAQMNQAEKNYQAAIAAGITVFASAGDFGATNGVATANANFPASSPYVTGVGGTMGNPYPDGLATFTTPCNTGPLGISCVPTGYGGEQVWNEPATFGTPVAGGGAPSLLFPVPGFQSGLGLSSRTTPDVSYNAAGNGGVLVVDDACLSCYGFTTGPIIFLVGGTSAGSPQWAAIAALADQAAGHPLGFLNTAIYSIGNSPTNYANDFHDITVGNNQLSGTPVGFSAATGYDDATGWGTPDVANLIPDLITPP